MAILPTSSCIRRSPERKRDRQKHCRKDRTQNNTRHFHTRGFFGGFDQANSLYLYATSSLQRDYLGGLSQADKCEEFIVKAKLRTKPFFWFPDQVNGNVIRIGGLIWGGGLAASVLPYWYNLGAYLTYGLAVDFLLRVLAGSICLRSEESPCFYPNSWKPNQEQGVPSSSPVCVDLSSRPLLPSCTQYHYLKPSLQDPSS